ncbi:hypothetical protein D3C87_2054090 [compost metagenome]
MIVRWRGRGGEIEDQRDIGIIGIADILFDDTEIRVGHQVADVTTAPGREIVETDDAMAILKKSFT